MSVQRGSSYFYGGVFKSPALVTTARLEWFLGAEGDTREGLPDFGLRLVLSDDCGPTDAPRRLMTRVDVDAALRELEATLSQPEPSILIIDSPYILD